MKIKMIAWAGWAIVLSVVMSISISPTGRAIVWASLSGAGINYQGVTIREARWSSEAFRPTIESVSDGSYPPVVPPCQENGNTGYVRVTAGKRTAIICVNPEGRIAEWLTERKDARLADPSIEFAPQIRFPHSWALDNGVCRVSYSYASIDDNGIRLGESESFPPSIRDRDGLTVCYADQAPSRYVQPKQVRR